MKIINCDQRSLDWHAIRRCKVTGTKLKHVMGTPMARISLIAELIAEEGTESSKQFRSTPEMERGTAEEPFAVKAFIEKTGKKVKEVGICISDEFPWLAHSPDGVIGKDCEEEIEIKNPDSSTMILDKIMNMVPSDQLGTKAKLNFIGVPEEYKWQIVDAFLVNEKLNKLHFVIYDARFVSDDQKIYIVEVERSNPLLQEAMEEAREALIKFREDWLRWKEIVLPSNF